MSKPTPSYPFPAPSGTPIGQIICPDSVAALTDYAAYNRSQGEEARLQRLRYLSIEEELERAYRYVSPSADNGKTFSLKFAEIVRAAANAYEIISRTSYARLYNDVDDINILNYLALDVLLGMANKKIRHLMAAGPLSLYPEMEQPFVKLAIWDKSSLVQSNHVPDWWKAYNAVKHTDEGLKKHATLANATSAVAALFLVTETVFGFRILQGGLLQFGPTMFPGTMSASTIIAPRWARLFSTY